MHWITQIIKKFLASSMSAIGAVWTLLEILDSLSVNTLDDQLKKTILVFAAVCWPTVIIFHEVLFFNCNIGNSFHLRIRFGNIASRRNGTVLVPIHNSFFCKSPPPKKRFSKKPESILGQLTTGKHGEEIVRKLQSIHAHLNGEQVPMGTCYSVNTPKQSLLFMSATRKVDSGASSSTPAEIRQALNNLFSEQTELNIENHSIYVPVLGTGRSGANLSYDDAIKLIAKAFILCCSHKDENSSRRIHTLEIVIRWKDLQKFDNFGLVCEEIRNIAHLCWDCKH